jgi:nucleotide-binding universal stress UspA family protein
MRREKTARRSEPVTYTPSQPVMRTGIRPYRRILVPLDGTPVAEAALRPAAELAARAGAAVNLVGVASETVGTLLPTDPIQITGMAEAVERAREREELLREVCKRVRDECGCSTTFELLTDTSVTDAIVDAARRLDADLVVAATHMRGWLSRTILGSTTEDLMEAGPFPVLIIPTEGPDPAPDTPMQGAVESIVVAVDPDARPDDHVIAYGVLWAQLWSARLTLAQSVEFVPVLAPIPEMIGPVASVPDFIPDVRPEQAAEERLLALGDALRQEGVDVGVQVLEGDPAGALLDFVESSGADLRVVGRHRKSFWDRLFEGSESSKLLRNIRSAGLLVCHEEPR